jgi:DNA-directed RNA polymerase alpha subunit
MGAWSPSDSNAREEAERRLAADIEKAKSIYEGRLNRIDLYLQTSEKTKKDNDKTSRNARILEMRSAGHKFSVIAREVGISGVAVAAICRRANKEPKLDSLSTRTRNCLSNEGLYSKEDVSRYTESQLCKIPNFGRRSLSEVRDWLSLDGLTLSVDKNQT